jgi:hypothetical protein
LTLSTVSHGFQRCMLYLWNSTHGVRAVHAGGLPHATDTKHAHRIKTEKRMRFMTNLQKYLYDANPFPGIRVIRLMVLRPTGSGICSSGRAQFMVIRYLQGVNVEVAAVG